MVLQRYFLGDQAGYLIPKWICVRFSVLNDKNLFPLDLLVTLILEEGQGISLLLPPLQKLLGKLLVGGFLQHSAFIQWYSSHFSELYLQLIP